MSQLLSQDEVRALLQQPSVGEGGSGEETSSKEITKYDFRDRGRMPRARMRHLQILHDRYAQHLGMSLSAYLRNGTDVQLEQIVQTSTREVLQELADPTAVFLSQTESGDVVAAIFDNTLAFALVDRLLGGTSCEPTSDRGLTEIEQSVLQGLVELVLSALCHIWAPSYEIALTVERVETHAGLVTLDPPEEGRLVLHFNVVVGGGEGTVTGGLQIVLPLTIATPLSTELARDFVHEREKVVLDEEQRNRIEEQLMRTPMPLTVDLVAREVTAGDLLQLQPGTVLNLGRAMDEPAEIHVGGVPKFEAILAMVEGQPAAEIRSALEQDTRSLT